MLIKSGNNVMLGKMNKKLHTVWKMSSIVRQKMESEMEKRGLMGNCGSYWHTWERQINIIKLEKSYEVPVRGVDKGIDSLVKGGYGSSTSGGIKNSNKENHLQDNTHQFHLERKI